LHRTEAAATKGAKQGLQKHAELSLKYGHSNTMSCCEHHKTDLSVFFTETGKIREVIPNPASEV
jgi:hypothetical protein